MKFPTPITITQIAATIQAEIIGDDSIQATGINEIHKVTPGDITFVDVEKYFQKSLSSAATIVILNKRIECPEGKVLLFCEHPFEAYDHLVKMHRPFQPLKKQVSETSQIHPTAIIEPNVTIADNVSIGENCYIQSGVVLQEYTHIGNNVTIQSGAIIGGDAFYFKKKEGTYTQWRSGGRVIIEDDVLIGAGCTIAKGVSGDTVIGKGSKLDCQIHIGHGVVIGKNCLLAAQVGIAGKTIIEDNVTIYGQVGIAHNIHIGEGAVILAKSGVSKSLAGGKTYFGTPAIEAREKYKELATLRRISKS